MLDDISIIYRYWGKAKKLEDGRYDYHLLVYHCLDVAAVGNAWLKWNPSFLKQASLASGLSEKAFLEWFLFFLSLHDLGKFRLSFQNLCPSVLKKLQGRENVDSQYSIRHDQLGYELYEDYVFEHLNDTFFESVKLTPLKEFLDVFAITSFGHHGIPPKSGYVKKIPNAVRTYTGVMIRAKEIIAV